MMLMNRQLRMFSNNLHVPRRNCTSRSVKKPPAKLLSKKPFLEIVDRDIGKADKPRVEDVNKHLLQSVYSVCGLSPVARVKLMQHVWKEAEKNGFTFTINEYNDYLRNLVLYRLPFEPVDFLKSMEGVQLNKYTHQLLIQAHAHRGEADVIRKLLEHDGSETINQQEHGWLMHAYIRNGDADSADIVEENLRVQPTIDLYDPVIRVHSELGSVSGIQDTFTKMAENGISPEIDTYLNMLESLAFGNHPKLIKSALNDMEVLADVADHFEPVIRKCVIRGHFSTASKLLSRVQRDKERLQMYDDHIKQRKAFLKSLKEGKRDSGVLPSEEKPDIIEKY